MRLSSAAPGGYGEVLIVELAVALVGNPFLQFSAPVHVPLDELLLPRRLNGGGIVDMGPYPLAFAQRVVNGISERGAAIGIRTVVLREHVILVLPYQVPCPLEGGGDRYHHLDPPGGKQIQVALAVEPPVHDKAVRLRVIGLEIPQRGVKGDRVAQ